MTICVTAVHARTQIAVCAGGAHLAPQIERSFAVLAGDADEIVAARAQTRFFATCRILRGSIKRGTGTACSAFLRGEKFADKPRVRRHGAKTRIAPPNISFPWCAIFHHRHPVRVMETRSRQRISRSGVRTRTILFVTIDQKNQLHELHGPASN